MWDKRIIEGHWNRLETVLIYPRPLETRVALSETIRPNARRVVQTLSGSKFALRTKTGALSRVGLFSMFRQVLKSIFTNDAIIGNYGKFVNQSRVQTTARLAAC